MSTQHFSVIDKLTRRLLAPAPMRPQLAPTTASPTALCSSIQSQHQYQPTVSAACAISRPLSRQQRPCRGQAAAAAQQRLNPAAACLISSPSRLQHKLGHCRRRAAGLPTCAAAAPEAAEGGYQTDNDGQTVEQRLALVQNMVATAELLIPYDASAVNMALILWCAFACIFVFLFEFCAGTLGTSTVERRRSCLCAWPAGGSEHSLRQPSQALPLLPAGAPSATSLPRTACSWCLDSARGALLASATP